MRILASILRLSILTFIIVGAANMAMSQAPKKWVGKNAALTAKTIQIDLMKNTLEATGNCKLVSDEVVVTSAKMTGSMGNNDLAELHATGGVGLRYAAASGKGSKQTVEGSCGEATWRSGQDKFVLTGDAHLKIAGGEEPVDLSANRIEVNINDNSFVASGDCKLVTPTAEMTGNEMTGKMGAEGQSELRTTGDVKVTTTYQDPKDQTAKKVTATGKQSIYRSSDQLLVITGDAALNVANEQIKGAQVTGDKITINLKSRKISVDTDDPEKNPTRLTIQGKDTEQKPQ